VILTGGVTLILSSIKTLTHALKKVKFVLIPATIFQCFPVFNTALITHHKISTLLVTISDGRVRKAEVCVYLQTLH